MKTRVLTTQANHQLTAVLLAVLLSLAFVFQAHSQSSDEQLALNESQTFSAAIEASENNVQLSNAEVEENFGRDVVFTRFETDNELNVELWMYCDYYWTGQPCEALLNPSVIEEEPLKVEKWMLDDHYWSGK